MENILSANEYQAAISRIVKLMGVPNLNDTEKNELEILLDTIDSYNGLEFLKVRSN
jgi:hypothetical protein